MAQENLNTSTPNSGLGDFLRSAFVKVQNMFTDLYSNKVDKETGKGLSANDFTGVLKDKLDNIEGFAEVNVQADFNQADSTQDDFIKNKPVIQNVDDFVLNGGYNGTAQDLANLVIVDGLISGGVIDVTDFATGILKVGSSSWYFATLQYLTSSITTFTGIALSSAGNQRYVAFFGTDVNTIIKVEGTESAAATLPNAPTNSVLLSYVLITDAVVDTPVIDVSAFVTTNTPQNVGGEKNFTNDLSLTNAFLKTNRGIYFYDRIKDSSQPYTSVYPDFSFKALANGSFKYGFFSSKLPNTQQLDLDYDRETGLFDFKLRPTVNGFDIALVSEVALKLDASAYNDRFKGKYTTLANLQTAFPTANSGDYAQVDAGAGVDAINYNYDTEEGWIQGGSGSGATDTDQLLEGATNLYYTEARVTANSAVVANTAKRSYPSGDETRLANTSGTNTGDNIFATDAELQTQTTPTEDNKVVRRRGLISWFNWLKGQVVNVTARWQFLGIGIGTPAVANAWLILAASTSAIASFLVTFGASYTGTVEGTIWGETTGKRLKIYRNGVADDFLFKNANASLVDSVALSSLTKNEVGDVSSLEIKDAFVRIATAVDYTVVFATVGFGALIGVTSTSASRTITLPLASTYPAGTTLRVKDESGAAGTNNITITRVGSDVIDGATTSVISTNYGGRHLYSDGVDKWFLI